MRFRTVLGAVTTATALTLGMGMLASAANAAPLSSNDWDYDSDWGYYYSNNGKAKAKGFIDVSYDDEESNKVHISGKLYDRDYRTEHQGGKCGYVAFRYTSWDDHEDDWSSSYKTYKRCGTRRLQEDRLLALRRRPGRGEGLPDRPVQQLPDQVRLLARDLQRVGRRVRLHGGLRVPSLHIDRGQSSQSDW